MTVLPQQFQSQTQSCTIAKGETFSLDYLISRDIDEQANSVNGWNQTYQQLSPGAFLGQTLDLCFNNLQLFREITHQHLYQTGSHRSGCCVLAVPIAVEGRAVLCGQPINPNHLMILQEGDSLDFCAPRYCDIVALAIPSALLQQFTMQVAGLDLLGSLAGSRVRSPHPAVVNSWRAFLLQAINSVCTTPHHLHQPNLRHTLSQGLLWHVITVLESLQSAAAPPALPPSRRQIVAQAQAYLESHLEEAVTIADLCIALNVSRRTLQYSFQDLLDINPVRYLKAIRLNHARRDLRASSSAETTVGDIAAKWGFWHLGRFSAEYREMFGELPSATLQK